MSTVKVFRSPTFVTKPVRAVFPHLAECDRFGSYSIDINLLDDPEMEKTLKAQADETLSKAFAELGTDKMPTNKFIRDGEYKDEPYRRAAFKMKATRRVKGVEVEARPPVVDAAKNTCTEKVFGGSLVKIAYYFQYTLMPTGTYLSLKLKAVQVLEHVGAGGETSGVDAFGVEEGFVSEGIKIEAVAPSAPTSMPLRTDNVSSGSDF